MRFLTSLLLLLLLSDAFAQGGSTGINGSGANGGGGGGTFGPLTGDVTTPTAGATNTTITASAVTNTKLANMNANSIKCNSTPGAAAPTDCNPLQVANLVGAMVLADVVATTNLTNSGLQTIDSAAGFSGEVVLEVGQTSSIQNGLWVMNTGAWTRPVNFPSGYVIAQFCTLQIAIGRGSLQQGTWWRLSTQSAALTIDTSNLSWTQALLRAATTTLAGTVRLTDTGNPAAGMTLSPSSAGGQVNDCMAATTVNGSIGDVGNASQSLFGPCIISDQNGHPILSALLTPPVVTGTGCTLAAGTNSDNTGAIVATGLDTCTLTFAGTGFLYAAPHCSIGNHGATVLANLTALPTAVHAIFATAAAGTFEYTCL